MARFYRKTRKLVKGVRSWEIHYKGMRIRTRATARGLVELLHILDSGKSRKAA